MLNLSAQQQAEFNIMMTQIEKEKILRRKKSPGLGDRTLHTVEIWETNDLQTIEACNNSLQAETLYLETLQTLQAGQTIKLVQAPQTILKSYTKGV